MAVKVERLKGLQLKFTAFYKMLLACPHLADKVVLLQVCMRVMFQFASCSNVCVNALLGVMGLCRGEVLGCVFPCASYRVFM